MARSQKERALELLLAWERKSEGHSCMTASMLHGLGGWEEKTEEVLGLVEEAGSPEQSVCALSLLREAIVRSSEAVLAAWGGRWTTALQRLLQEEREPALLQSVCGAVCALVDRFHRSSSPPPPTFHRLLLLASQPLQFSGATQETQLSVLPAVTHHLALSPPSDPHFKAAMKGWALQAMFSTNLRLSQEASRVLVLLHAASAEQWRELVLNLISALHWALGHAYQPVTEVEELPGVLCLSLPPLSVKEPQRSSTLLQAVTALSRALCYCLLFPPSSSSSMVRVPLEEALATVFRGLALHQQQVTQQSAEALLLLGMLPQVHTAMWNILTALIRSCGVHLLPYSALIETSFVQGLTLASSPSPPPHLLLSLHRALCGWVRVRGDIDHHTLAPIVTWLLVEGRRVRARGREDEEEPPRKQRKKATNNILYSLQEEVDEVQLSAVETLHQLTLVLGPSLPRQQAEAIGSLPLELLAAPLPASLTSALLRLLLACVEGGEFPPLTRALHLFSLHSTHPSLEVQEVSRRALCVCSHLQHPTTPPLAGPSVTGHPHQLHNTIHTTTAPPYKSRETRSPQLPEPSTSRPQATVPSSLHQPGASVPPLKRAGQDSRQTERESDRVAVEILAEQQADSQQEEVDPPPPLSRDVEVVSVGSSSSDEDLLQTFVDSSPDTDHPE